MKARLFIVGVLLCASSLAGAQDYKSFSLEAGAGIQPIHMTFAPTSREKHALADKGQFAKEDDSLCPTFSLSEVWRLNGHWELCLTEGISWKNYLIVQHGTFGTDPSGKPRYDLQDRTIVGKRASDPFGTLYGQVRFIWSPKWKLTCYSAVGGGLIIAGFTKGYIIPSPGITPVGMRFGGRHLYGFAELTVSPVATLGHGGIGWKF